LNITWHVGARLEQSSHFSRQVRIKSTCFVTEMFEQPQKVAP
uniref:Pilus assembly protein PilZ n=1 Tax=Haemonchus placei TaxID=6290 RepID=A0A0N4W6A6_HAEPC